MNRRNFFKSLAGVLALPLLPMPEPKQQWNKNFFIGSKEPGGILNIDTDLLPDMINLGCTRELHPREVEFTLAFARKYNIPIFYCCHTEPDHE